MKKQILGKVKRTYKKDCNSNELCKPMDWFDKIEQCEICKKTM